MNVKQKYLSRNVVMTRPSKNKLNWSNWERNERKKILNDLLKDEVSICGTWKGKFHHWVAKSTERKNQTAVNRESFS